MIANQTGHLVEWCIAAILNAVILCLIIVYSPKTMGKYPWLLAAYSIFNMTYVTIDVIVTPSTYIVGRAFLLVSLTNIITDEFWIFNLMVLYCCSCCGLLVFLSFQFLYRYIVVCKTEWLPKLTTGRTIVYGVSYFFLICGTWTINSYFTLYPDEEIFKLTNERYSNWTGRSVMGTRGLAQAFEKVSTRVIVRSYIGMFVFCSMLSANWAIIIYCGWALNKALKSKGISNRTKTMQKELFRALIFQLIVPICCVFGPLGLFLGSAIVGFDSWDTDILCMLIMFDPMLEPIVLMYFIKCYRQPVLRFFTCGRQKIYQWGNNSSGRASGKTAPQGAITKSNTQPDPETTSRNVII